MPLKAAKLFLYGSKCTLHPIDDETIKSESLVPWNNESELLIDKYDVRCYLNDIPISVENENNLNEEEEAEENLCEKERYYDLYKRINKTNNGNDGDVKQEPTNKAIFSAVSYMYDDSPKSDDSSKDSPKPDEDMIDIGDIKQESKNKAIFSAVSYMYDDSPKSDDFPKDSPKPDEDMIDDNLEDIPYQCPLHLNISPDIILPSTERQAAKVEKTALFIAKEGNQMEIYLKTKQSSSNRFDFLNHDHVLNQFYKFILNKIKTGEYIPNRKQLFHLTKQTDNNKSNMINEDEQSNNKLSEYQSKIDISNTSYFSLINKYRPIKVEEIEEIKEKSVSPLPEVIEENKTPTMDDNVKKQYYDYYYNYYCQISQNPTGKSNYSEEEIINAATLATETAYKTYLKDKEHKIKLEEENLNRKKFCLKVLKYLEYYEKYGEEFENEINRICPRSIDLNFLKSNNNDHEKYKLIENVLKEDLEVEEEKPNKYKKWQDYLKEPGTEESKEVVNEPIISEITKKNGSKLGIGKLVQDLKGHSKDTVNNLKPDKINELGVKEEANNDVEIKKEDLKGAEELESSEDHKEIEESINTIPQVKICDAEQNLIKITDDINLLLHSKYIGKKNFEKEHVRPAVYPICKPVENAKESRKRKAAEFLLKIKKLKKEVSE